MRLRSSDTLNCSRVHGFVGARQAIRGAFLILMIATGVQTEKAHSEAPATNVPDLGTRSTGDDWPAFLGPSADGKSRETGLELPWPEAGPQRLWRRSLGESYGIGSVSRGRYLQFDYAKGLAQVDCLNAETGQEIWKFTYASNYQDYYGYNSGPRTSPVIDGDRVYVFGAEGMLHCLSLLDGRVKWKVDTQAEFHVVQNFFGVGSTPVVYQDLLLVMIGGSPEDDLRLASRAFDEVRPNGSAVVAFDKETGQVRYRALQDLASYSTLRVAEHEGRHWAFAFCRAALIGFDPRTGAQEFVFPWRAKILESVNASTPVVWDDRVFISETYGPGSALLKFRAGGFDTIWSDNPRAREKAMQTHWNTCIYHDGYLYGSSGRHTSNADLRCIEAATGRVCWSQPGLSRCSLLFVDGHLICLTETGTLIAIQATPDRYALISEFTPRDDQSSVDGNEDTPRPLLDYPAWAAPTLSHGLLYVRGKDQLACFELIRAPKTVE